MATVEAAVLRVLRAGRLAHVLPPQAHSHSRQQLRRCRPLLATGRMQPPSSNGLELCELMSQWHDPPTRPCHWLISSHSSQPLELGGCIRSRTTYRPHPVGVASHSGSSAAGSDVDRGLTMVEVKHPVSYRPPRCYQIETSATTAQGEAPLRPTSGNGFRETLTKKRSRAHTRWRQGFRHVRRGSPEDIPDQLQ